MLYLVLTVDPFGIPLKEEGEPPKRLWPVSLPAGLEKELLEWNERIADIVAAPDLYDQQEIGKIFQQLNNEGENLARRIEIELNGNVKVRYLPE